MIVYKKVLIAVNCNRKYNREIGVYLDSASLKLIGSAVLYKRFGKVYADLTVESEVAAYYPEVMYMDIIDTLILKKQGKNPKIKSIGEQTLKAV